MHVWSDKCLNVRCSEPVLSSVISLGWPFLTELWLLLFESPWIGPFEGTILYVIQRLIVYHGWSIVKSLHICSLSNTGRIICCYFTAGTCCFPNSSVFLFKTCIHSALKYKRVTHCSALCEADLMAVARKDRCQTSHPNGYTFSWKHKFGYAFYATSEHMLLQPHSKMRF